MATAPNTSHVPSPATQQSLLVFVRQAATFLNNNFNLRSMLLERDRTYQREKDFTEQQNRASAQNRSGNPNAVQNITIPVVMPQVESATAFLTNTFLTGYPIFPVVSKPTQSPAALQMETLVGEHSIKFGYAAELMMAFRDGLKYNLMAVEVSWQNKKVWSLENDPTAVTKSNAAKTVETYYQGNVLKRLDPYNLILDTRVKNPSEMHIKGEFAGYTELFSRIQLKQLFMDLGAESTMNARTAFESGEANYTTVSGESAYFLPQINPQALLAPELTTNNWLLWAGLETANKIRYNNMYEVTTLYARIIPVDFGIIGKAPSTPAIFKIIVVNRNVVIFFEKQTNAHNFLPIIVGQPNEDGLGWQTKSFGDNATPMQDAATALYNSAIESQRRKVYDRMLYDPSRINKKDIDNVSPVARIPVKQTAYGQPLESAVYSVPYHDEGIAAILGMSRDIVEMSNIVTGQNRVSQGQFQKGNKTRHEFQNVMDHSDARMTMMSILIEYRFLQPVKEIIKLNILQYQPPTTLYNRNTKQPVDINPVDIRQEAMEFKLSDGVLPVDKLLNMQMFETAMQLAQGVPQFAAEYDLMGMLMYYMQNNGASWINDFRRDPAAQQQFLSQQQQLQGNSPAQIAAGKSQPAAQPAPTTPLQ